MSQEASAWFQEQWNTNVIHVYQNKGYLTKGMTTGPTRVVGKKLHFNIAGKGVAQPYTRGDKVKVMNASRGEVLLDATDYDAADYIYQYDLDRMQPNEVDTVRETAAMALGRKHDEVLYDLFRALTYTGLQTVGSYADTALPGPTKILEGRRNLFNQDLPVEDGMTFCGMPPMVFDDMMRYVQFSNSQYVGPNLPWADGQRKRSWQQIHFFELPLHLQTLPAANQGRFFMWHKSAVGSGYTGEELRTGFKWELDFKRWYYQSTISAGTAVIQAPGIIEFKYKADLPVTFT